MTLKTTVIIVSFTLISLFSLGSFFVYTLYLNNYKKEFKNYLSTHKKENCATILNINPSELYCNSASLLWEDDNKEVVYKNMLYDVLSIKNNGLTVQLTVISDKQEMELKNQFASVYDVNSHSSTKNPFNLLKMFFGLKYITYPTNTEFNDISLNTISHYDSQCFKLIHKVIPKETPPPDLSV